MSHNGIHYIHSENESFMSKVLKVVLRLSNSKPALEKGLKSGKIKNEPAPIPSSILKKYKVETDEVNGFKVWTISSKEQSSDLALFYFHGGGYVFNVYPQHWQLIEKIIEVTGATIVVHDYPLVPKYTCKDALEFTDKVYELFLKSHSSKRMFFVGDSSGGGLALSYAQYLRNEGKKLPEQIILSAPWLDVTLSNPEIANIDKDDKMLGIQGLKMAGKAYADKFETTDYRVSPIYGNFEGLPKISVFIGTHDLFWADAKKLKTKLDKANIPMNYFEYPKMFHNWWIVVGLNESKNVLNQVSSLLTKK